MLTITLLVISSAPAQQRLPDPGDPRVRRAAMERAVQKAGPESRAMVESYGPAACEAVRACSPEVCRRLAEAHNDGRLSRLPSARDLLAAVGQPGHGDEVALWALDPANARQLEDVDAFNAFLRGPPLEYCLNLRQLAEGAAEERARRLSGGRASGSGPLGFSHDDLIKLAIGAGAATVLAILIRAWERRRNGGVP